MPSEKEETKPRRIRALFIVPPFPARTYPGKTMAPDYFAGILARAGHSAEVLDLDVHGERALKRIRPGDYDLVGISYLSFQTDNAMRIAERIAKRLKRSGRRDPASSNYTPIVVGGPGAADPAELARLNPAVDAFNDGEGFEAISEIADSVGRRRFLQERPEIRGLTFFHGPSGKPVSTGSRPVSTDIDPFFPPARLHHSPKYDFTGIFGNRKTAQVLTQIGCPNSCVFCAESTKGPNVRLRSLDSLREELDSLAGKGYKAVYFDDSTFTHDRRRALQISDLMKEYHERHGIVWGFNSRVDYLDEEVIRRAKEAGCVYVYCGVESMHPDVLRGMNKVVPRRRGDYPPHVGSPEEYVSRAKEVYAALRGAGLPNAAFLIFGGPKRTSDGEMGLETLDDAKLSIDRTVSGLAPDSISINIMRFIPDAVMSSSPRFAQLRGRKEPFTSAYFSSRYRKEKGIARPPLRSTVYHAFEAASDHYPIPPHMTPEHCYDILKYLVDRVNAHNQQHGTKMRIWVDPEFDKFMPWDGRTRTYRLAPFRKLRYSLAHRLMPSRFRI